MLRQQEAIADGKPNLSLADFVAPRAAAGDYLGAFAVTAGLGADELAHRFEREHDDYSAILVKALADRLAEAFAAYLHQRARSEWGIDEARDAEELHRRERTAASVRRSAIRRAPITARSSSCSICSAPRRGHRAHRARRDDAGRQRQRPVLRAPAGALLHASAGSARIRSRATRGAKGQSIEQVERWLTSNLAYEPARC